MQPAIILGEDIHLVPSAMITA